MDNAPPKAAVAATPTPPVLALISSVVFNVFMSIPPEPFMSESTTYAFTLFSISISETEAAPEKVLDAAPATAHTSIS